MKWLAGIGRGLSAVDGRGSVGEYFSVVASLLSKFQEYFMTRT